MPDITPDGEAAFTGLTLSFISDTTLPAATTGLGGDVRVHDVYLNGAVVRAVGDATTQNEAPTTGRDLALHWDSDDQPAALAFEAAPVGEYAYVELRIASRAGGPRREAYALRGEVRLAGDWTDFVIRAEAPAVIAKAPAAMRLEAGRPLTILVELSVAKLVEGIDFSALPEEDDVLRLDERTPAQLEIFTGALTSAFRARQ